MIQPMSLNTVKGLIFDIRHSASELSDLLDSGQPIGDLDVQELEEIKDQLGCIVSRVEEA